MPRHEDTVVSRLPDFDQVQRKKLATRRPGFVRSNTRVRRAVASLDGAVPPPPAGWGDDRVQPVRAPVAPPPVPRKAAPAFEPIPEVHYEPSVVVPIPQQQLAMAQQTAERVMAAPDSTPAHAGRVIVMFSCRGGAGATSLAVNTAASLARSGKSVCVVDLDLQLGDVFVALDLDANTSLAALAREASTIDQSALKRRLARHDSGVYALSQAGQVDDVDGALIERLPALLATLAGHFDYVIVDGVRDFDDYALTVLDMADHIAMILTQDVASVRRAARAITLFRRLGYSDAKVDLVLNRYRRRAAVSEVDVLRALGLSVKATVRNDFKRMQRAFDEGALVNDIARGKGVAKDLDELADLYAMRAPQAAKPQLTLVSDGATATATDQVTKQRDGLFGFLRRGRK